MPSCSQRPSLEAVKAAKKKLKTQLAALRDLAGPGSTRTIEEIRSDDRQRKKQERKSASIVAIPPCANRRRRNRLEKDDAAWLRWYCDDPCWPQRARFWYDFTGQQLEMIAAIREAIVNGGDQSIAASRGEGKTKLFERTLLKHVLSGAVSFAVLFGATGSNAEDSLDSIKHTLETGERLRADYPEVCIPIVSLENTPNRAHYQVVSGKRHDNGKPYEGVSSRFSWCGREIILPRVPGSPSAGAIIATRGLDAAVRGLNKFSSRVDVAAIDDPDTEETVNNPEQAAKLEKRIDMAIAGLGGQQRSVARVMLTTLQRRECVSAKFTDPKQKPSWKGRRFRFLVTPPDRLDLWEEYVELRQLDFQGDDPLARRSHRFYVDRRAEMDAGAVVANPHRYNGELLPDGSQTEVSALERYYNEVARIGKEAVSTEYDNDPPEESGPQESGISARRIQRQVSGYDRRVAPAGCVHLVQAIDVRKIALHFVVRAFREDGTGYTIDYGVQDVRGTTQGSDEGVDEALKRALSDRRETVETQPYRDPDGNLVPVGLTLIDAGWRTEAIYQWCLENGQMLYKPAMGFGRSAGCTSAAFREPTKTQHEKRMGQRWFLSKRPRGVWLVCTDADFWKSYEHDHWMRDPAKPGALLLYGHGDEEHPERMSDDQKKHFSYAKHLTAETEVEEVVKGALKRYWKSKSDSNHYLDASYMTDVAATMLGVPLLGTAARAPQIVTAGEWFSSTSQQKGR
jgi:hypothetical protein